MQVSIDMLLSLYFLHLIGYLGSMESNMTCYFCLGFFQHIAVYRTTDLHFSKYPQMTY